MAVPTIDATAAQSTTSNTTSQVVDITSMSPVADDIILIIGAWDGDAANPTATGYTTIGGTSEGTVELYFLWKRAGASESDPTVNWTGSEQVAWRQFRISGCHTSGSPIDVVGNGTTGTSTSATPTSPASTDDDVLYIGAVAVDRDRVDFADTVSGTGWTETNLSGSSGGANGAGIVCGELSQTTQGTPANPTFSSWASDGFASRVITLASIAPTGGARTLWAKPRHAAGMI